MSSESLHNMPSIQKTQDAALISRVLKTSFLLGALLTFLLFAANHLYLGWGFFIGATLSLFSFVTIAITIPFLLRPNAPRSVSALLVVVLFMKLPIYCVGLYLAARLPGMGALACMLGACLTPAVITLKTIGKTMGAKFRNTAPKFQTAKPAGAQSGPAAQVFSIPEDQR